MLKNWKTNLAGALALLCYLVGPMAWPNHPGFWNSLGSTLAGLGLMAARDAGNGSDAPKGPIDQGAATAPSLAPADRPEAAAPTAEIRRGQ